MKTPLRIVVLAIVVLFGLMAVNGSEGQVGNPPYLWARYISEPWYLHIGNTDPVANVEKFDRSHFGFPCRALIIDRSNTSKSWYAKLDLRRFCVNLLVAVGISVFTMVAIKTGKRLLPFRTQKSNPSGQDSPYGRE